MLVFSRSKGKGIVIDDDIIIRIVEVNEHKGEVIFQVEAPVPVRTGYYSYVNKLKKNADDTQ